MKDNFLQIKKALRSVLLVLLLSSIGMTKGYAYDFSAVCYTGQTLYYNILNNTNYVELTYPYWGDWIGDQPNLVNIPQYVTNEGITYEVVHIGNRAFSNCTGITSISIPNTVTYIDDYAFDNCSSLSSIYMGNSVIEIGISAFSGCTGLVSITLPNSMTGIAKWAFSGCENLVSVNFSNSLVIIGTGAFAGCTSLASINIPNSVETICENAFADCTSLTSVYIPESVVNFSVYRAMNYYGNYVWVYGSNAFAGCYNLTSIAVDMDNPRYDSRNYCNAVIDKENDALLSGCSHTFIPAGVRFIGQNAFRDCTGLTSITIPSSVIGIGKANDQYYYGNPFEGCSGLNSIYVNSYNPKFDSRNNCNAIIVKEDNSLLVGCKNTVIPNSVFEIRNDAFSDCTSLTSIEIPNSVTTIGEGAFWNCSGLTSVTIGNSVTSIGSCAFYGCSGLTSATISNSVTSIGGSAFQDCSGLTSVTIGSSVASIGNRAFAYCSNLDSISVLAQTPPTLSYYVFDDVPTDIEVEVPCGTLNAYQSASEWNAFTNIEEDCTTTFTITTSANPLEGGTITGGGTYMQSATCTLTAMANFGYSFASWTENGSEVSTDTSYSFTVMEDRTLVANFNADNIVFADANVKAVCVANWDTNGDGELSYVEAAAVTDLGRVFRLNQTITSFDELQYFTGITTIVGNDTSKGGIVTPQGAFYNCKNLTSIIIPNNVTTIGSTAFMFCQKLESIELPDSLTTIGGSAFNNCYKLTTIDIPNSVISIGESAFNYCSHLDTIVIPNSVISIGKSAFYNCSGLTTVEIGSSVDTIGSDAFSCGNISSLTIHAETPPTLGDNVFYYVPKTIPVYVPCGTANAYQVANGWNEFTNYREMGCLSYEITATANPPEGGTVIGAGSYSTGETCTLTAIPNEDYIFVSWIINGEQVSTETIYSFTVTYARTVVANYAINGNIIFADANVKSICVSHWDTNGDGELSYVEAASVTDLNTYFQNNSGITSFNELRYFIGLSSIRNVAFRNCSGLTSFSLPNSILSIGHSAFYGCTNLESITVFAERPPTISSNLTFNNVPKTIPVYVPCGSSTAYQSAAYWSQFTNYQEMDCPPEYHFTTPGNWSEPSNWQGGTLPNHNAIVFIEAPCQLDQNATVADLTITAGQSLTLQTGKTLTVTGTLTNTSATGLVIKDGAQLVNASANVAATMEYDVTAFGNANPDGWYTIASPMNGMPIAGSNFLTPNYDLYRFNETNLANEEWENFKANLADFNAFENGRGYLYANDSTFSPSFTGTLNNTAVTYSLTYTERPDDPLSGFNLIGNPFPHDIYKGAGGAIDNANLVPGYYTLTNEGTWEVHDFEDAIQPGQGILVKATAPTNLTIAKSNEEAYSESGGAKMGTAMLRISIEGDDGHDRAFVYFGQGVGLDKVEDLGQNAPSLAIRNGNGDFAIAHFDKKSDIIELVFTTPNSGDATLKVKAINSDFDSLHLFDSSTGTDIDLLQQPSYTFSASAQAGERHFKLLYKQSEK